MSKEPKKDKKRDENGTKKKGHETTTEKTPNEKKNERLGNETTKQREKYLPKSETAQKPIETT